MNQIGKASMPKPRNKENKGLPSNWQFAHGAYYFRVPIGLEEAWDGKRRFRLGKTLSEAYRAYSERVVASTTIANMGSLFDRYLKEVVPGKAATTQADNRAAIARRRSVFGHFRLPDIRPQLVYQYYDGRKKKTAARRELEVLSHTLTKAVEWGVVDRHPIKGQVRLPGEKPRDRYVEDWEILECLSLVPKRNRGSLHVIKAYISLKLLTGMSRGDLLRLQPSRHFKEDGIHVQRHKTAKTTGKRTIYEWTAERRAAVDAAITARPVDISPFLFCNAQGNGYLNEEKGTAKGWDSMWQNFMQRVLSETKVKERFTEHDLRAKCASDAESIEKARMLLSHVDSRMTQRVYRRKPDRV